MMRLAATIGCVWAAVLTGATAQSPARPAPSAGGADVAVVVVEPADGATVVGQAVVTVASRPAGRLAQVTVYIDGREQCVLERAPWSCRWDAGRDVREHHVRVVAISTDGRRLVANRHTRGLDVSETVNVAAVQVPVVVTGPDGRFVRGLTRQAFTVIEDGQRQKVDTIIDASLPLELIVAADISGSMEGAMPHVQEGKLKGLAVSTTRRVGSAPDIPTVAESGVPGFEISTWESIQAPAGTPADVADALRPYVDAGCRTFNLLTQSPDPSTIPGAVGEVRRLLNAARQERHP